MQFFDFELGKLKKGQLVEVALKGSEANVKLMDERNFEIYKKRGMHIFAGGRTKPPKITFKTPNDGKWHVVVDLNGLPEGSAVKASVKVFT